ncbi:hypothetical protein [Corynebacterium sp. Marseille-P8863]|uniref:hypothetical protein n=1 Tax=Corynebacterium sp. Marseille-P8863 TaxID=2866576 RepID=UPI002264D4A5|nr:hypothetical protein [Corynebacterium sp. Marseille-P8863]
MAQESLRLRAQNSRSGDVDTNYAGVTHFVGELIDELDGVYAKLAYEADRDERLLKGISKREREIELLKSRISSLETREKQLEAELQRLKNTKGYRLQQRYWRLRKAAGK